MADMVRTVGDLRAALEGQPDDRPVVMPRPKGHYGPVFLRERFIGLDKQMHGVPLDRAKAGGHRVVVSLEK